MKESELKQNNIITIGLHSDMLTAMSIGVDWKEVEKQNLGINDFLNSENASSYVTNFFEDAYFFLNDTFLKLTGYDAEHIAKAKLPFLQSIIYKHDVESYCAICKLWYRYIMTLPLADRNKTVASIQFRIVTATNEIKWIILHLRILQCDYNGSPAAEMGTFQNHTPFKTDNIVSGFAVTNGVIIKFDHLASLPIPHLFAPRELELIKHSNLGLSNKETADKMKISIHTVTTYRSKILREFTAEHFPDNKGNKRMIDVINFLNDLGALGGAGEEDLRGGEK